MQIRTFSIVAGSLACNARCPECIAGMTPANGLGRKEPEVNWRNFEKACRLAQLGSCTTAMITSKGEPTMFPDQITKFLEAMAPFNFPIIEMQTNGSYIAEGKHVTDEHLKRWHQLGLTTVAVSVVHYEEEKNRQIYFPHKSSYIGLVALIDKLHKFGFTVRLTTVMRKGYIDSVDELQNLLAFVRKHKVEQLTCTPLTKPERRPDGGKELKIFDSATENALPDENFAAIRDWVHANGALIDELEHGARIFDVAGQNLCLSNCITVNPGAKELRSIIFFPDGHVRYAWQYSGAIIF